LTFIASISNAGPIARRIVSRVAQDAQPKVVAVFTSWWQIGQTKPWRLLFNFGECVARAEEIPNHLPNAINDNEKQ
jgi:hypothetical protein